jgi:hypothetical protein
MSNKLTEYRNKCLTQLEKHVGIERQWFQHLLQHQEKVMQLQTQNWYQSWKIGWLEKKVRSLGFKDKLYQELDADSAKDLSEWQRNIVKQNMNSKRNAKN